MDQFNQSSFLPPLKTTPLSVKAFLLIIGSLSLLWGLSELLFPYFFSNVLEPIFSLHLGGMTKGYFWQLITYSLIEPASDLLSIFYLIHLAFILYIFWVVSYSLIGRKGVKQFFTLYFSGTLLSALVLTLTMNAFSISVPFLSSQVPLYTFLFAWMTLNPKAKLYLFFAIPVSFPLLLIAIWGTNLLIDLSHGSFLSFVAHLTAAVVGYFYAVILWQVKGPISFLHPLESLLQKLKKRSTVKEGFSHNSKIYDFQTGEPVLTDDNFMDAMLTKISAQGEGALTRDEKKRMKAISKRKTLSKNLS